jgi:hypothetical protein
MGTITLKEARRRTKLDLISDKGLFCNDPIRGITDISKSQKQMEARYPRHKLIREGAIRYFLAKGHDVYPRGITVNFSGTCPDFAIFNSNQIIFVECLTAAWTNRYIIARKRRIEKFAPLIFIIEDKPKAEFEKAREKIRLKTRVKNIGKRTRVYWFNPKTENLRKCRPEALCRHFSAR